MLRIGAILRRLLPLGLAVASFPTLSWSLPAPTRIRIITEPEGAEVFIGGVSLGVTPPGGLRLTAEAAGTITYRIRKSGYIPVERTVTVRAGEAQPMTVVVRLEPAASAPEPVVAKPAAPPAAIQPKPAPQPVAPMPVAPPTESPAPTPTKHAPTVDQRSEGAASPGPTFGTPSFARTHEPRFKLLLDGGVGLSGNYSESRSFEEFVETGSLTADYKNKSGPGFLGGVEFAITPLVGIRVSVGYVKRDGSTSWDARFPHPLYFRQPRSASDNVTGLSYKETSGHLDLVLNARAGPLDLSLFGGASVIKVATDLLDSVQKTEAYPYDQVTIRGVTRVGVSDSAFGVNGGAGVDFRIGARFGFGAQGLFARAKAKLASPAGGTIDVDAGGFHVTGGLRFRF